MKTFRFYLSLDLNRGFFYVHRSIAHLNHSLFLGCRALGPDATNIKPLCFNNLEGGGAPRRLLLPILLFLHIKKTATPVASGPRARHHQLAPSHNTHLSTQNNKRYVASGPCARHNKLKGNFTPPNTIYRLSN